MMLPLHGSGFQKWTRGGTPKLGCMLTGIAQRSNNNCDIESRHLNLDNPIRSTNQMEHQARFSLASASNLVHYHCSNQTT